MDDFSEALQRLLYDFLAFLPDFVTAVIIFAASIPNSDVYTSSIINYSRYPKRRMDLAVGVAYGSDLELVRKAALVTGVDTAFRIYGIQIPFPIRTVHLEQ